MGRQLAVTVHVANPDTCQMEVFEAGTVPPEWACAAITNPDVWTDDGSDVAGTPPSAGDVAEDGQTVEADSPAPPPQSGPGSGRDVWVAYAAAHDVDVPDDASRDDIISRLDDAGIPTG